MVGRRPCLLTRYLRKGYFCSKISGYALDFGVPATALSLYATATSGIMAGGAVLALSPLVR